MSHDIYEPPCEYDDDPGDRTRAAVDVAWPDPLEGVDYRDPDWDFKDRWGRDWPWDVDDLLHSPGY